MYKNRHWSRDCRIGPCHTWQRRSFIVNGWQTFHFFASSDWSPLFSFLCAFWALLWLSVCPSKTRSWIICNDCFCLSSFVSGDLGQRTKNCIELRRQIICAIACSGSQPCSFARKGKLLYSYLVFSRSRCSICPLAYSIFTGYGEEVCRNPDFPSLACKMGITVTYRCLSLHVLSLFFVFAYPRFYFSVIRASVSYQGPAVGAATQAQWVARSFPYFSLHFASDLSFPTPPPCSMYVRCVLLLRVLDIRGFFHEHNRFVYRESSVYVLKYWKVASMMRESRPRHLKFLQAVLPISFDTTLRNNAKFNCFLFVLLLDVLFLQHDHWNAWNHGLTNYSHDIYPCQYPTITSLR